MSAMKMDFICKDSPEKDGRAPPAVSADGDAMSPSSARLTTPNAAKLSALLNSSHDSDVEMDAEPMEEEEAVRVSMAPPMNGSEANGKTLKTQSVTMEEAPANFTEDEDISEKNGGLSDNEDSEDEQGEFAAWQDVDLNPAVDLVRSFVDDVSWILCGNAKDRVIC